MGPKKGKHKSIETVDGVDTSKMNREQLELYAHKILEELEGEREERNFFQLERDKIRTFWEITKHQLEEAQAILRNAEREKEELSEKHQEELTLYKQKVKHLMYEHQTNLAESKAEHMVALKIAQDEHAAQENHLIQDKKQLKKTEKEFGSSHINEIRALKLAHAEETSKLLKKFESEAMEMEKKYEHKLMAQYESFMLKHNMEMAEVEERKDSYIVELTKNHEKTFAEMKNYYNDITMNNLSLIKSMKEQMETMKNHEDRLSKQVQQSSNENKKFSVDLRQAQGLVTDLTRRLGNYEKDKQCLASTKKRLAIALKELEHFKWENEVLELRFEKCQSERDELHARFVSSILEIQQKTGLKNVLLEKKLEKVSCLLEQRESQMSHVLVASKEDPNVFTEVNNKFEETLNRKNAAIRDLQYEVAKVCKAHDDLLTIYEEKLRQYGVPEADFGVQPIRSQGSAAKFGRKSSFVTVNR